MQAPIINDEGFAKLFAHVQTMKRPGHYRLLVTLMQAYGLRPIELAHLDSSWFRGGELRIPHGQTKRKRPRTLPTTPEVLELLRAHMGNREGAVFLNREGLAFNPAQMSMSVRRLFKEAGVEGSTYSARRALATRLLDADVNLIKIRDVLGHQDVSTTQAYCTTSPDMMRKVLFG